MEPNLTGIGKKQPREYLLESIVAPNANVAVGFESVTLPMKSGAWHTGAVKQEAADWLELNSPEDGVLQLVQNDIAAFPACPTLTKRELCDLVEFLANLK